LYGNARLELVRKWGGEGREDGRRDEMRDGREGKRIRKRGF